MKKKLYVKENKWTPTFYVPIKEEWKFITIYTKTNKSIPIIWHEMVALLESRGVDKTQAMIQARDAWDLFYDACISMGEWNRAPFIITIKELDMERVKD